MEEEDVISKFSEFPEGCISNIICFTSPKDVCRWSTVSKIFNSASDSDTVWEHFLPSDYEEIISRSVSPINYSSKKQLFFLLSNSPILLDAGKLSFKLSKSSGKKCYMLCARELGIAWGDDSRYWNWKPMQESRFTEVAELEIVCWLEIRAKIRAQTLSLDTTYAAYLVYKFRHNYMIHSPCKACIRFAQEDEVRVELSEVDAQARIVYLLESIPTVETEPIVDDDVRARQRMDGWMELKLGQFVNNQDSESSNIFEIMFWQTASSTKYGLIVEGVELRPIEEA